MANKAGPFVKQRGVDPGVTPHSPAALFPSMIEQRVKNELAESAIAVAIVGGHSPNSPVTNLGVSWMSPRHDRPDRNYRSVLPATERGGCLDRVFCVRDAIVG